MVEHNDELREILTNSRTIAVVGIKQDETADAFRVPHYMQQHGFQIMPVNPKLDEVMGEPAVAKLTDLEQSVDIVNLFRAADHMPEHAEEILAMNPRPGAVWMQLGIHHGSTAAKLRAAGIRVVQDRCIMVDYKRLIATGDDQAA